MGKKYEASVRVDLLVIFEDDGRPLVDQSIEAAETEITGSDTLGMETKDAWIYEVSA